MCMRVHREIIFRQWWLLTVFNHLLFSHISVEGSIGFVEQLVQALVSVLSQGLVTHLQIIPSQENPMSMTQRVTTRHVRHGPMWCTRSVPNIFKQVFISYKQLLFQVIIVAKLIVLDFRLEYLLYHVAWAYQRRRCDCTSDTVTVMTSQALYIPLMFDTSTGSAIQNSTVLRFQNTYFQLLKSPKFLPFVSRSFVQTHGEDGLNTITHFESQTDMLVQSHGI